MKKIMTIAVMMTIAIAAQAMTYSEARKEALFLSDKMAYELNLSNAQYEAVYEINLDYMMSVGNRNDIYGSYWSRRNADLRYVLTNSQYNRYIATAYFYRPMSWSNSTWTFGIYRYYTSGRMYKTRPTAYTSYRGGNNRKASTYYATRAIAKPSVKAATTKPNSARPAGNVAKTTPIARRTGTVSNTSARTADKAPAATINNKSTSAINNGTRTTTATRTGTTPAKGNFGNRK